MRWARYLRSLTEPYRTADKFAIFLRLRSLGRLRAERICSALRLLGELFCAFLFARFCREMLLSEQMPPPAFAVLLYRAVYFRFSRGLIAILPRGLDFCAYLRLLFPINSTPSSREPFYAPYRSRLFSRPSVDLAILRHVRAFMLCLGYFYTAFCLKFSSLRKFAGSPSSSFARISIFI